MEQNLKNMENFLRINLEIKEKIAELAPDNIDFENEDLKIQYSDKIFKGIKDLQYYFQKLMENFDFPTDLIEGVKNKLNIIEENIVYAGANTHLLKKLYPTYFSDMSETFIENVNENFIGYLLERNVNKVISSSKTVNELLHGVHSYVMSNEDILQSLNIIAQKHNNDEYSNVTLYGRNEKLAKELYDSLNDIENTSDIDILSLKDKILMMVRDKGHALTIDVDLLDQNLLVKYFIPKICNVKMVNDLKGVTKVKDTSKPANGIFETTKENFINEILDFINKVPTDMDMELVEDLEKLSLEDINIQELTNEVKISDIENVEETLLSEILNEKEYEKE